jgi:hypothetical protein
MKTSTAGPRIVAWAGLTLGVAACSVTSTTRGDGDFDDAALDDAGLSSSPDSGGAASPDSGGVPTAADAGGSPLPDAGGKLDGSGPMDASPLDSAPEAAGPTTVQLDIPPRTQWTNADGYCGEISIQSIALYYGTWVSEELVRTLAGGELLIGVNGPQALSQLAFDFTEWDNSGGQPQFQSFMVWMKTYLLQGAPSFFGAYLTDGNDDPDYDHIMPLTGIVTASPTAYDPNDVLTWNDNFGDQITRPASNISATRASCAYSSTQGGCIPVNVDYGIAVTGIVDPQHVTLPVSLSVAGDSEPNVSEGASPAEMTGNVTVSGLTAGQSYTLLRYDDYTQVPTNASAAGFLGSSFTYHVNFTASGPRWTYTDPNTFTSSGSTTYRCVAQ